LASLGPSPLRWSIVLIDFDPTAGHEQAGTRRALVVSYEPFHRSGLATVCPISAREPKYPNEIRIPAGNSGQTKNAVILVHQVRTVDLVRVTAWEIRGHRQYVTDTSIRRAVRLALLTHFGLDLPDIVDGADAT
jgi:mRNA-degrading endonuclease toxin of MazEF toxin-antitoxin module